MHTTIKNPASWPFSNPTSSTMPIEIGTNTSAIFDSRKSPVSRICSSFSIFVNSRSARTRIAMTLLGNAIGSSDTMNSAARQIARMIPSCFNIFALITFPSLICVKTIPVIIAKKSVRFYP